MSTSPTHEELQDLVPAAALELLDPVDLELVREHVRTCTTCARMLEDYRGVTAELALLLPRQAMAPARSTALRARLLARAPSRAEHLSPAPAVSRAAQQRGRVAFLAGRWAGWSVAAALAGVLLVHHAVHRPLAYGWLVAGGLVILMLALGAYAGGQRRRVSLLEARLAASERRPASGTADGAPERPTSKRVPPQ